MPGGILGSFERYLSDLVAAVNGLAPLDTVLAAFPLPEASIPPDLDPDTRAFLKGLHAFNVWRALEDGRQATPSSGDS